MKAGSLKHYFQSNFLATVRGLDQLILRGQLAYNFDKALWLLFIMVLDDLKSISNRSDSQIGGSTVTPWDLNRRQATMVKPFWRSCLRCVSAL